MRSARTATREEPLLAAAGERLHSTEDPAQSKINKERLKKKKKSKCLSPGKYCDSTQFMEEAPSALGVIPGFPKVTPK